MQPDSEQTLEMSAEAAKAAKPFEAITPPEHANGNLDLVLRIPVTLKVLLGSASMPISQLTKLGRGAVIPLDRRVGEPVDVMVNGKVIARGEIVVLDEDGSRFGITLTEMGDTSRLTV
jgi:flagellar motor switch protein FliN